MKFARLPALALVAALAGAVSVQAQDAAAPAPTGAHHGWDPAQFRARMEAHRAERLKALHDVLAIRPDQESAFQAFASATRPPERTPGAEPGKGHEDLAGLTTPERLDRMAQRMQEREARHQQRFAQRAAATKALYAALDPTQRKAFDSLPLLRGDGHRGGWGRGRGRFGGHGMGDKAQG
jgi:periplasmic protein CpxP/Spy